VDGFTCVLSVWARCPGHASVTTRTPAVAVGGNLADVSDAVAAADERGEDHVDAVVDAEQQVLLVLLGDGGQVDGRAGQVAALLAAQQSAVLDRALEEVRSLLGHLQRDQAVVDVHELAHVHHLRDHTSSAAPASSISSFRLSIEDDTSVKFRVHVYKITR